MEFLKLYRRSPVAMFGLILLLGFIAMALVAGIVFPKNPLALVGRPLQWPFTNPHYLLGTDNRAGTSRRNCFTERGYRSSSVSWRRRYRSSSAW
jgi:ABC-type dipeptide/oligopeptide/nickel transport system permease subunit